MEKIIDLHTHLETLGSVFTSRSLIQNHQFHLDGHIRANHKTILSVAMYVPLFAGFDGLIKLINDFRNQIEKTDSVKLILNKNDLESDFNVGIILHIESARVIENHRLQLPELFDLGVRGIIPMHFVNNKIGISSDDPRNILSFKYKDTGLSVYGKEFIKHCNKLGMWIDLSHSSDNTAEEIVELADNVMISHVGVRDLVDKKRNQSVKLMKKIASKKGVIGLIPWTHLIGDQMDSYENQFNFLHHQGLENHIAIGSDFGAPIKTSTHHRSVFDLARSINKFDENKNLYKWNNAFEFFKRVLPKA